MQHLYLVRGALDALAARSAAYRPRPELREPGMALIRAGRASSRAGTTLAMIDADLAFHRFIYEAAHNPLLTDTARIHWLHTRRAMGIYLGQPVSVRTVWAEHQAILSAVVRGEARMAERLAREHCEASAQIILRHLFEKAPSPSATTQHIHRRRL